MDNGPRLAAASELAAEWLDGLEGADTPAAVLFRYRVAMVAADAGVPHEAGRIVCHGRTLARFTSPSSGANYEVEVPEFGESEGVLIEATRWVLFRAEPTGE